ncbi:SPL family radical SAM protein [Thermobrachium celere]|uniref:SPL family radical SAM protein n=1 Tax=Thermobrachium celere TaxID=53422 RepID=UPI00059385F4|nr:deoxyribodipyrimidine photo-lyase [Thermobrachium celere]
MQTSKIGLLNRAFSHIYVEKRAKDYELTKEILNRFKNANIIEIDHYKDIFCRSNQNFVLQKQSPKLILAVKQNNLIYRGADVCEDFGNKHFFYTSIMMNCIYDCEYCYLQGMYTSANIVIFVNIEDYFLEVKELLKKHPVYLCISYDTDLLAFERITNYVRKWIDFARFHKDLVIEIRTKSANFDSIKDITSIENVIFAWTLSPDEVIKKYEHNTPSLQNRLNSIRSAIDKGWKVRLCFDPILYIENWKEQYEVLIDKVFKNISGNKIYDVSLGLFRVSKDYLKRMRKQRPNSVVLNFPFENEGGVSSYNQSLSEDMIMYVYKKVSKYVDKEKIYI